MNIINGISNAFLLVLIVSTSFAQKKQSLITDEKIAKGIERAIPKLKKSIEDNIMNPMAKNVYSSFAVDTFKIEYYARQKSELKNRLTLAEENAITEKSIKEYQALLNKYVSLLERKLNRTARESFIQSQQAWNSFRNKELIWQSTAPEATGMYKYNYNLAYLMIIKQRVFDVFFYYSELPEYR